MKCPTCGEFEGSREEVARHYTKSHPDEMEDRFWMYVDRGAPDECWMWDGTRAGRYGSFNYRGEQPKAHRVSYKLAFGEIENQVNHLCGNCFCVNPNHLYDGTQQENVDDAVEHGVMHKPAGEQNPSSKLTEGDVVEIRERNAAGESQYEISSDYPVTQAMVSEIVRGKCWPDSPGPTN